RRDLHAAIVRAFEGLYPERAGEQTSWLTLHAFRGELWDRAVAYLRGSELPSLDGYPNYAGFESGGVLWWVGDHEHVIRTAPRELSALSAIRVGWSFGLRVAVNLRLGQAHHSLGEYSRAREYLRKNVELIGDELLHDRS